MAVPRPDPAPAGPVAPFDLADLGGSMVRAFARAARQPDAVARAVLRFGTSLARLAPDAMADHSADAHGHDRRFTDATWRENPAYRWLLGSYRASRTLAHDLLAAGASDPVADLKASIATDLLLDALAPTNFAPTNPVVVKRAIETGGASLLAGAANFVDDLLHNGGRPRQVDRSGFVLGENLAATPGRVVFRNELMELIQYAPATERVHAVPLLASPPWINKYYVMDLAPGRSFVQWAVEHGRTVFAISYRNPGPAMGAVTMEDYLVRGLLTAIEVVREITGSSTVDIAALCLGGLLTAIAQAYLAGESENPIGSVTLLNTLVDFAEPGALRAFTDAATLDRLDRRMAREGGLDAASMSSTFDVLRANDLIFNYVESGWLLGKQPPAFDILAWNADSTRMPAAMHSYYLRTFYLNNELAAGELEIAGRRLSLSDITDDVYLVGAINDHIVPWHGSYRATQLLGGSVRYVLSSGGHIAGIVNPPGHRSWYQVAEHHPASAHAWREGAEHLAGSWWEDWVGWAGERAGELVAPPPMGSDRHPALGAAPGDYVHS